MDKIKATASKSGEMRHELEHEKADGMVRPVAGGSPGALVFSGIGPRITLAPPDAGGSGGDGGNAGGEGGGGENNQGGNGSGDGGDGGNGGREEQKLVRPDYIPESFWDAEKGFKADDLNALVALKSEQDSRAAQVPAEKDGYKVALPPDFKIEGLEIKDGESPINENDPRVAFARDYAHANGFTQPQFEGLIALGVQMDLAENQSIDAALKEQAEALGAKGKERMEHITSWLGAKLGGEFAHALAPMIMTVKQVQAFERLMQLNRGAVPGNPGAGRDTGKADLSDEEYAKMSPTEKINYARQNSKK
jgi:hypothetical protein